MTRRGWLLFGAMCFIWGVPYLLIRVAVTDLHPVFVAFARTLLGGLLLLPLALRQRSIRPALRRWPALLLYTLVEISGPWVLLGFAETRLTSSTTGVLVALVPLIAAVLVAATGGEGLTSVRLVGLVVGFGGVITLVGLDIDVHELLAVGAIVLTAIGYAVGPIVISRRLSDTPSLGVVAGSLLLAALIYLPVVPFVWPQRIPSYAAWSVAGLAVVCTATAFVLFFALIAEVGPARATVITYVNPAVAILLGVWVLAEPLTVGMLVGFPLVVVGSVLATRRGSSARLAAPEGEPVAEGLDAPLPEPVAPVLSVPEIERADPALDAPDQQ